AAYPRRGDPDRQRGRLGHRGGGRGADQLAHTYARIVRRGAVVGGGLRLRLRSACRRHRLMLRDRLRKRTSDWSGDRSWRHHPLNSLARDFGNEVVVAVVVKDRDTLPLRHSSDQQIREADRSYPPTAPQRPLDSQGTPPVLIVSGQPFVTGVPVRAQLI